MFPKLASKSLLLPVATAVLLISFAGAAATASAHEWTLKIEGKVQKVEAKIIDFDGTNVLLEASNGVRKKFPIVELDDADLEYLKNIVVTRQSAVQEKINLKQLEQERLQNQLTYRDIWEVQIYAPNGQYIRRRYLARSNQEAAYQAREDYPNARIGSERKISQGRGDFRF